MFKDCKIIKPSKSQQMYAFSALESLQDYVLEYLALGKFQAN